MNIDNASNIVKSCIASSDLIPILKNIYIGDGRMVTFNGVQGISVAVSTDDAIKCVVNGDAFVKIVNSIPTNKLVLSMPKKQELNIASSRTKRNGGAIKPKTRITLVSTAIKLFSPYLFDDKVEEPLFTFKLTDDVIEGLASTSVTLNENANNVALSGVMLDINDDTLKLYATDSVRMARYICEDVNIKKLGKANKIQVLLPKQFCTLITGLAANLADKIVSVSASSVYIKTAEVNVYTKTPQSVEFPDYEKVIARFNPGDTYCPTSPRFVDAINRCLVILTADAEGLVDLSFKGNKMKIEATSAIGEVEEIVNLSREITLEPLRFKAELLKQAVSTTEEIAFVYDDENKSRAYVGRKDRLLRILAASAISKSSEAEEETTSDEE